MLRYCESFSLLIFLKLNKEIPFLFSRVLRCSLLFECTRSFQTIFCRYYLRKQMLKISATKTYEVLFVWAALFLKFCSLFFVMCQKVKRRLVVRSNDDRRLLLRFLASVAVTEISKPIIEVLSFCDRERAQPLLIKRILLTFW